MKNFAFALLLIAAVIVGVGAYRGWFTANKARIQQDEDAVTIEMHDLGRQLKEKTSDRKGSVKDQN